ncbi:hypothetical protein GCM10009739_02880 [Microbacterium ulmi]
MLPAATHADLSLTDAARRSLDEAALRLFGVRASVVRAAAETDWQADAARRFHALVDEWADEIGRLAHLAATAREDTRRAHDRLELGVWTVGG